MARKLIKQPESKRGHDFIYRIDPDKASEFIKDCLDLGGETSIEFLDCKVSYSRQKVEGLSIKDVLDFVYTSEIKFFSFVLRKDNFKGDFWDFCASGIKDSVEYFLFIEVKEESGCQLVEKYKLKKNDEL